MGVEKRLGEEQEEEERGGRQEEGRRMQKENQLVLKVQILLKLGELKRVQSMIITSIVYNKNKNIFYQEKNPYIPYKCLPVRVYRQNFPSFVSLVQKTGLSTEYLEASQIP